MTDLRKATIYCLLLFINLPITSQGQGFLYEIYHNVTAHYNGYFIAKESIKEVMASVEQSQNYNYDELLPILPVIDSSTITANADAVEKTIRMASIAIQRHRTSRWTDDCYILIGRARYLQADFPNAIQTFKFVNTDSEDDDSRHRALCYLIRTFADAGEINNAIAVIDYLKRQQLNKDNRRLYHMNSAYVYRLRDEMGLVKDHLAGAVKLTRKKDGRARVHYQLGQLYQEMDSTSLAYFHYKKSLRSNPSYQLSFYTRLNIAQVSSIVDESDIKATRKYYEKLLADDKNEDFRDKIYYEMGRFEKKQGNLDKAIGFYRQSTAASAGNNYQKAQSYLALGKIYYEELKNYNAAKNYYDSVVTFMSPEREKYAAIKTRSDILNEFVIHYNTIQQQDSLLFLASLDTATLYSLFSDQFNARVKEEELEARQKKRAQAISQAQNMQAQAMSNQNFSGPSQATAGTWYFYDQGAVARGKGQFRSQWGDRPLVDNWRVSGMMTLTSADRTQETEEEINSDNSQPENLRVELQNEFNSFLSTLPFTDEDKIVAQEKVMHAMYNLGNIYFLKLREFINAENTYVRFLQRFDTSSYKPEVLYQLYLSRNQLGMVTADEPKKELLREFPESVYAKLILNPNYLQEEEQAAREARHLYENAYRLYSKAEYDSCRQLIQYGLQTYGETRWADYFQVLDIQITGKQQGVFKYQYELDQFTENNPDSELTDFVATLRAGSEDYQDFLRRIDAVRYITDPDQPHLFLILYQKASLTDSLSGELKKFCQSLESYENLTTGSLILDNSRNMLLVNEFNSADDALSFRDIFRNEQPFSMFSDEEIENFVISRDNFQILYQSKELEGYKTFFNKNYPL